MFAIMFDLIQTTNTNISIDWGVIVASIAPMITIIVTWYLQRRTTKSEAEHVALETKAAAAELAKQHETDKQEAIARQEAGKQELLTGQQTLADAINSQLMIIANARIKTLQEKLAALGQPINGTPPLTLLNAADLIDMLEQRLLKAQDIKEH